MQELELEKVISQIKNNQLTYNQFYNVDIDVPEYYAIQHYHKFKHDNLNINQKLSIVFLDIEVFSNHTGEFLPSNAISPISAITIYNSKNKTYYSYFLILPQIKHLVDINLDTSKLIKVFKKDLIENKYISDDENFELSFFTNELELIESCWNKIHEIDPVCLSGYYSDGYDIPYIYNRLKILYNDNEQQVVNTLSKLNIVKIKKFGNRIMIQIPDYPILDIKHLYCPREEGGLNYGKPQPNYSLDFISDQELQLKKLDYKSTGDSNLDTFYLKDPINYFKYNIIDVVLTARLNDKTDHINFHNILRRDMKCPLTQSIRGTSALFSSMFSYEIQEANQYFRYGIHKEIEHSIDQIEIEQIDLPKTKLIKNWTVKSIDNQIFRKILSKYPGAYVAQGYDKIITTKDDSSIIVDADALALYPSTMKMYNISFDSLFGYIINSKSYKFLEYLNTILGKKQKINNTIKNDIFSKINVKIEHISPQNKNNNKQYYFFMFYHLLNGLNESNVLLSDIINPKNIQHYLLLKSYLIPLLHLFSEIVTLEEYHPDMYKYIVNNEELDYNLFIIQNINQTSINIIKLPGNQLELYLKENNVNINLSGSLFYTHEKHTGLLNKFITNKLEFRKQYKTKRDTFEVGSDDYIFYDNRQKSAKINANSSYGLSGLSSFIYSNRLCAASTTLSGRLTLKLAQMASEYYIDQI